MSYGQLRAIGHERSSPSHRMLPPRPLRDDRCRECRMRDHSKRTSTSVRESCPHRNEFAPTGLFRSSLLDLTDPRLANRFSLLADVDRKANQTKWSFNFIQSPSTSVRRRGKRGGKTNRLKHDKLQQQLEERKSESENADDLCQKMATMCLNEEETRAQDQQCLGNGRSRLSHNNFTFCTDGIRHHWMPQFRPNSLTSQFPKSSGEDGVPYPRPLERCLTQAKDSTPPVELTELKRKESRFFPLSAFLATPDTAARHPSKSGIATPSPAKTSVARKQLPVASPTAPQKAAASAAHRALADQKATMPPLAGTRNVHTSRPASPSPLAQTSTPLSPPPTPSSEAGCPLPMQASCTPLLITPSSTASPTLTLSPSISAVPSLVSSPSLVCSFRTSCPRRSPPPPPLPRRPQLTPTTPSSLGSWTGVPTPETASPALPIAKTPLTAQQTTIPHVTPKTGTPKRLTTFFDRPCPPAVPVLSKLFPQPPSNPTVQQNLEGFLKMGHANPCWCSAHNNATPHTSVEAQLTLSTESRPSLVVVKSGNMSGSDLDDVLLTPSPLGSDFEDLETTDCEGDFDEEWTVVTPDERDRQPSTLGTPNIDFDDLPTGSEDGSATTWTSSLLTPLGSPTPTLRSSVETPTEADTQITNHQRLNSNPWTSPISYPDPEECTQVSEPIRDCKSSANTSAVEWPTLQEAVQIKRTRREKRSGTNDADVTRFCNQMVDWMV